MSLVRRSSLVVAAAVLAAACSSSSTAPPPSVTVAASGGDGQVGAAGQPLATALAVVVKDQAGAPKAGVAVSWSAVTGGGSLVPTSGVTDATGSASTTFTLGLDSVLQTVTATSAGATGSPVTFNETATIQGATQIALAPASSGNAQTDSVLATLAAPYRVVVRNENNAPVMGVIVNWAAPVGVGSVSAPTSTSDASGTATVTRTLGPVAGSQTATASLKGLIGNPVTFTATATAGAPTQIAKNGGDGQTGPISTALPTPHSVIVRDAHGNPVAGVAVNWVVGQGGGSVNPTSGPTGANGVASTVRTLGALLGTQTDTALSAGLSGSPIAFTATATPPPVRVSVGDFFFQSVHNTTKNPAVDTVTAGGTVTWTWIGAVSHGVESTGSPSFTNSTVMSAGSYSFKFTSPGAYTYDCIVHGLLMTGTIVVQ